MTRPRRLSRSLRFWWQRRTRGWDDSETWSLDSTIAEFTLPRLRRFREITIAHPSELTPEQWNHVLDELIWLMEITADGDLVGVDDARRREACRLLGEYFHALWW